MEKPFYGSRDPIAALATPLAESALAIIRTSGNENCEKGDFRSGDSGAIRILAKIFSRPKALLAAGGNSIVHGWILEPADGKKLDEVLVSVYRAPKSYSGEDSADISCHGGVAAVKAVMSALKKAGFREALPGEFTFRAFMNGKLDLTRAESVMELVAAKTGRGREQAVKRLLGVLEKEISEIKNMLMELLAAAEIYLDYSEDEFLAPDDESEGRLPRRKNAEEAIARLKTLANLWSSERIYAEGAQAVLAGLPNAGKSSLFNMLIREDRSIVTGVPGTTRDWIEEVISVEDIPLRLIDTAGLKSFSVAECDEAERIGVKRSLDFLKQSDLVLYIIDGEKGITEEDKKFLFEHRKESRPLIMVWNKADLAPPEENSGLIAVSAKTGEGIPLLMHSIAGHLIKGHKPLSTDDAAAGPGTPRQKELLDAALASVEEALALADGGEPLDIIAPQIRAAVNALGEITGEVSNDGLLELMFSRFCVGK